MEYKDYYATLRLKKDASQEEIQKAYRKLARKYHPDVNKSPDSELKFKEIGEAYEVLKDPEKRKKYDQYGAAWRHVQQGGGGVPPEWQGFDFGDLGGGGFDFGGAGGGEGFSSFFEMLFGSRGAGGTAGRGRGVRWSEGGASFGPRPGADAEAQIALTLDEAIRGGPRELSFADPSTGKRTNLSVKIPPGVRSGQRIRLAGRGLSGEDGAQPGDLYLRIEVPPDPRFRVEGNDIYTQLPVSPWEAALGGEAQVETPQGRVGVRIPPGSSSGRKIRLRGRGLPQPGNPEKRGDLYAEIKVVVPERLSERERELFEQLAQTSEFKARA